MRLPIIAATSLLSFPLHAGEVGKALKVELISDSKVIGAGQPFALGLHLHHPAGAHTYWKNPGIVGLATEIKWDLPPGFEAGKIRWPAPQVVSMAGHAAQGYEGETLLIIPITPPQKSIVPNATFTARVSWMCCGKTCQPAVNVPFSITLPVAATAEPDPSTREIFEKSQSMVPLKDPAWEIAASRQSGRIQLRVVPPAGSPEVIGLRFFTADGQVDSSAEQRMRILTRGEISLDLAPAEAAPHGPKSLPGVMEIRTRDDVFDLEIDPGF